jgi:hypothetical protein
MNQAQTYVIQPSSSAQKRVGRVSGVVEKYQRRPFHTIPYQESISSLHDRTHESCRNCSIGSLDSRGRVNAKNLGIVYVEQAIRRPGVEARLQLNAASAPGQRNWNQDARSVFLVAVARVKIDRMAQSIQPSTGKVFRLFGWNIDQERR